MKYCLFFLLCTLVYKHTVWSIFGSATAGVRARVLGVGQGPLLDQIDVCFFFKMQNYAGINHISPGRWKKKRSFFALITLARARNAIIYELYIWWFGLIFFRKKGFKKVTPAAGKKCVLIEILIYKKSYFERTSLRGDLIYFSTSNGEWNKSPRGQTRRSGVVIKAVRPFVQITRDVNAPPEQLIYLPD